MGQRPVLPLQLTSRVIKQQTVSYSFVFLYKLYLYFSILHTNIQEAQVIEFITHGIGTFIRLLISGKHNVYKVYLTMT